jgi:hypothetical protein
VLKLICPNAAGTAIASGTATIASLAVFAARNRFARSSEFIVSSGTLLEILDEPSGKNNSVQNVTNQGQISSFSITELMPQPTSALFRRS